MSPVAQGSLPHGVHTPAPGTMPFLAHLGELRRRLIYVIIALTVTGLVCFSFAPTLFDWLRQPLASIPNNKMIVLGPLEMFMTHIKIALLGALFTTSPFLLLQLWLFVAPGLYPQERRWVVPFVVAGSVSFVGGAAFCFYVVLPASFAYLVGMVPTGVEAHYSVALYFSLVIHLMLAFGVVFELPLILTLLGAANVTSAAALGRFRKAWIVISVVIGGILTPTPDPMTQMMMAVPLMLFFELGILGVRLVDRRRAQKATGSA